MFLYNMQILTSIWGAEHPNAGQNFTWALPNVINIVTLLVSCNFIPIYAKSIGWSLVAIHFLRFPKISMTSTKMLIFPPNSVVFLHCTFDAPLFPIWCWSVYKILFEIKAHCYQCYICFVQILRDGIKRLFVVLDLFPFQTHISLPCFTGVCICW